VEECKPLARGAPSTTAAGGPYGECWPQYAGAVPSRDDVFDWEVGFRV
jgi:hypothetical protein